MVQRSEIAFSVLKIFEQKFRFCISVSDSARRVCMERQRHCTILLELEVHSPFALAPFQTRTRSVPPLPESRRALTKFWNGDYFGQLAGIFGLLRLPVSLLGELLELTVF